jgi:preprotein translocase subunit SecE
MEKLKAAFKDYSDELLYKVEWPSIEELQSSTVTIFVACLLLALVIFIMDLVFGTALGELYKLF